MTLPSQRAIQRRDEQKRRDEVAVRAFGSHAIIDGEWDEFGGSCGVRAPRSALAYPQRCAGAE